MLKRAPQVGRRGTIGDRGFHTVPEVKKWLAQKDPAPLAFALHPTSSSWLNLIER
ncbi:MAG TPA: hypothetical protein VJ820_19305 [Propionibacteriaceae bacterium]|nr:hypothetical protein [Propionibacteriaceae bacterium]